MQIRRNAKISGNTDRISNREEYCPHCCNLSLRGAGDGRAVCDSCGAEYQFSWNPKLQKFDKQEIKSSTDVLNQNSWVVVNIEPKLNNYASLVPIKVDTVHKRYPSFTGWAWGERIHEYSQSSIVYKADSEEDAMKFIENHKGTRVSELKDIMSSSISNELDSEEFDDIEELNQEFTSENTSINSSKLPAIFKMVSFKPGSINIDYGGGRFDNVAEYLAQFDVTNLVYDPYNRTSEHNQYVIRTVKNAGGADTATCSNVLNVIKEPEVRLNVLKNISKLVKPNGEIYITVYEGSGKGNEGPTKSGYQLNRKTVDYLEEIQEVFPDARRKGKLIIANNKSVKSSSNIKCSTKLKRISRYGEFDNGHVIHNDWREMTDIEAENLAKQMSIENPDDIYYVKYDDIMNPDSNLRWIDGQPFRYDEVQMRGGHPYIKPVSSTTNIKAAKQSIDIDKLKRDLENKVFRVITSHELGFSGDETAEYTVVEVSQEDSYILAEIRAEVDYDDLMTISEKCNPIVQKYDPSAYFEPVEPGITDAYIHVPNSVKSSTTLDSNKYNEYTTLTYQRTKYSIHYTHINTDPSADPLQMFKEFKATVSEIHPYDDGDYNWAKIENGVIYYINKDGVVVDKSYYMTADDWDLENNEWCDAVIDEAVENLSELNKDIEPKIIHNSTDINASKSYGGAYDIDPEQYFTREDLVEFAESVIECIANAIDILLDISELNIDGNEITIGLTNEFNNGGFNDVVTFNVDMRKIKKPSDLMKYSQTIASKFIDSYENAISESTELSGSQYAVNGFTDINDFDDDELANMYGGDRNYCPECGSRNYHDGHCYDCEYPDEDLDDYSDFSDGEVEAGNIFDCEGIEYEWIQQYDSVHLDFDNWAVWEASLTDCDDDNPETSFFVVDTDTGFIDWGPVDTLKEAQEFLESKVNDWENDVNAATNTCNIAANPQLETDEVVESGVSFDSWYEEPDDDNGWEDLDPYTYEINIVLDTDVSVEENGDYQYVDESYDWAKQETYPHKLTDTWTDENGVKICDSTTIVEYTDNFIWAQIPLNAPGMYHIHGDLKFVFNIDNVSVKRDYFFEPDGMPSYDEDIYTDGAEVDYDEDASSLQNFSIEKK